jgi:ADP-dependent NAD(P)H-hydrate dehydratase
MLRSITNLPRLPLRPRESHKGTFGRVLIVAGSVGLSGAAILAGMGALRGGAGLVQIASPAPVQPVVAAGHPCYLTAALPADATGALAAAPEELLSLAKQAKVIAFGPGLGRTPAIAALLLAVLEQFAGPILIDADGLFALASFLPKLSSLQRVRPPICTPHPGEFAHLLNLTPNLVQAERKPLAVRFAAEHHVVVALKGHGTVVTDGQRVYVNHTGNSGMAKGGSGDVLTGLIAAFLAQGMADLEATQLAVYVHGLAGDLAAGALGEYAMLPTDLLDYLPAAIRKLNA